MQQSFKMLSRRNGLQSLPRFLIVLVYLLLQTHSCKGQSQVIGPSQPIVAKVDDDIILPCHLEPAVDVVSFPLEWTRPDLNPTFVHMRRAGQDLIDTKHPSYMGRTSVSNDELKNGNVSLKLSKLKPSDVGRYKCYIPKLKTGAFVELVVGAASTPSISLSGLDQKKGGVVLQCESTGWYPEPEVFWLDGEGNLLSAGPTETVRGPDDLYTVSSRVTVEKRHSNSFTCRVQQNSTNQTRETHIHVPDDFFEVQSSYYSTTAGLAVSLAVCILVILILGFLVWKFKTKRSHRDEPDTGVKTDCSKRHKHEDQVVTEEETESQQLLTHETVQMKDLNKGQAAGIRPEKEQHMRKVAEKLLELLKEELENKKTEIRKKQSDLQQLDEEKKKKKKNVKRLKEQLENKITEVKTLEAAIDKHSRFSSLLPSSSKKEEQQKKKEAEQEVENLTQQLQTEEKELDTKTKEFDDKQVEVQQLQEQIQKKETSLKSLTEKLQSNNKKSKSREQQKLKEEQQKLKEEKQKLKEEQQKLKEEQQKLKEEKQKLKEEKQRREEAENRVQFLEEELQKKIREMEEHPDETIRKLQQERRDKEEAQSEFEKQQAEVEQLQDEIQKMETGLQSLMEDLQSDTLESKWPEVLRQKFQEKLQEKITERESEKQNSSSLSLNSARKPAVVFKVDPLGKYIQLRNTSTEDQQLGGWVLKIQVNYNKPIIHRLEDSFNLMAGQVLTVWCRGYGRNAPQTDLVLEELKLWRLTDTLQVSLISHPGEIPYNLDRI